MIFEYSFILLINQEFSLLVNIYQMKGRFIKVKKQSQIPTITLLTLVRAFMFAPLSNNNWTILACPLAAAIIKADLPINYTNNKQTQIIITTRNYNDQTNKQTIDNEKKKSNETIPKTNPKIWFI